MALSYNLLVTGDCQNIGQGAFYLEPIGGNPPYNIFWISPDLTDDLIVNDVLKTGLNQGSYLVEIYDSTTPTPESLTRIFQIGGGLCLTVDSIDTTCGLSNGSLNVSSNSTTSTINFYLYELNDGFITSASTNGSQIFSSLDAGIYYIDAFDIAGCSGRSSTCVVKPSQQLDFDLVGIDNSVCSGPNGRVYVTNQNGQPPYSYLWNTGSVNSFITGLTAGNYSVTVTDSAGCSIQKSTSITEVQPVGFVGTTVFQPSCFQSNGQINLTVTGGSKPYYFLLSNGEYLITYNESISFSALSSGQYSVVVTDAGLCTATTSVTLAVPDAFTVSSIIYSGSNCNLNNGSISATVIGGNTNYTFRLYDSSNNLTSITNNTGVANFNSLSSGIYQLIIDNGTGCQYQEIITITNTEKYSISSTKSNPTCGNSNGSITVNISNGATYPCIVNVNNLPPQNVVANSVTFSNLQPGLYNITVTDAFNCVQTSAVVLDQSDGVNFNLITKSCGDGDDGTITALITTGEPPFIINWSQNVGNQTGIYVTGLTTGNYDVTIIDSNGCIKNKSTKILCGSLSGDYKTYEVCDNTFTQTPNTELGVSEMFYQGYQDLTSGETGCILNSADFTILVDVGSTAYTSNFFSTISLNNYPSDEEYRIALQSLLNTIDGFGSIIIDENNNIVILSTDCEKTLSGETISVGLKIGYDICCLTTTTTTCQNNNCLQYKLEGPSQGDYLYYDCLGNFNAGVTDNLTFCSDQSFGSIVSGPPLTLINLGCCPTAPLLTTTTTVPTTTTTTNSTTTTTSNGTTTTTTQEPCNCYWVQNFGTLTPNGSGGFIVTYNPTTFTYLDCNIFPPVLVGPITLSGGPGTGFCTTNSGLVISSGEENLSIQIFPCDGICDDPNTGGGGSGNCSESSEIILTNDTTSAQINQTGPLSFAIWGFGAGFPLQPSESVNGTHGNWSGQISVPIIGTSIYCISLYINGVLEDTTTAYGTGSYLIGTVGTQINSNDCVEIIVEDGICI